MIRPFLLIIVAAVALSSGCRHRAAQELLERDLRAQEDRIFHLEGELEALVSENMALKHILDAYDAGSTAVSPHVPTNSAAPRVNEPPVERVPPRGNGPYEPQVPLAPPEVQLPQTSQMQRDIPAFRGPPAVIPPSQDFAEGSFPTPSGPPPLYQPAPESIATPPAAAVSGTSTIQGTSLNPALPIPAGLGPTFAAPLNPTARSEDVFELVVNGTTRGIDSDGTPGDEGLLVVLEARDAQGKPIAAPAAVSIVAMDPLVNGEASRLARWDFTSEQTATAFRPLPDGQGMYFELRWPALPPQHNQLLLFARYTTADGRKLNADGDVNIALLPADLRRDRVTQRPSEPTLAPLRPNLPGWAPATSPAATATPAYSPYPADSPAARGMPTPAAGPAAGAPRTGARWSPYR